MIELPEYLKEMLISIGLESHGIGTGGSETEIFYFSCSFPEKGNKKKIEYLLEHGWEKVGRRRQYRNVWSRRYEEKAPFFITMHYNLPTPILKGKDD